MKVTKTILFILMSILVATVFTACDGTKEEGTTVAETEEYTGEPIEFGTAQAKISKKEAKSIAKDDLINYFDTCEHLIDYDFYKTKIKDDGNNYRVELYTEQSWDWTFIGGDILTNKRLYMCDVNKDTGEVSDKSDPNWEKVDY